MENRASLENAIPALLYYKSNHCEEYMRKTSLIMLVLTLFLAACSSQPTPLAVVTEAPQPIATEAPAIEEPAATEAPAVEEPAATEAPSADPPSGSAVSYQIVPGESTLQYEVAETFLNENNRINVAVGVTPQVSGSISVDMASPQNSSIGTITADISQFTSDSSRRDGAIRNRFIQTSQYPMVTFVPSQIDGLPATYQAGQEVSLQISGDLTVRETTRPVQFSATIKIDGNTLTGNATTTILMSDFGFGPISIAGILNTEDEVKVTLNLVARP